MKQSMCISRSAVAILALAAGSRAGLAQLLNAGPLPGAAQVETFDSNEDPTREVGAGPRFGAAQGLLAVDLVKVADGLGAPLQVAHAGDGSGRMFIVDQNGKIGIHSQGAMLSRPFLDLSAEIIQPRGGADDRGLLGVAFHPDFGNNGRFFVRISRALGALGGGDAPLPDGEHDLPFAARVGGHEEILAEYRLSSDPNVADPNGTVLFRVEKPEADHNGGPPTFGPDGNLYFALGDGGGVSDGLADSPPSHGPMGNGQNPETALGKVLRIDVNSGGLYSIPGDNPFVNQAGLDEIFAMGVRNPRQMSFDDGPGGDATLWMADAGQALAHELNRVTNGGNQGWPIREGSECFNPFSPGVPLTSCRAEGLSSPAAQYAFDDGVAPVGGFVYRGAASPSMRGLYFFGDSGDASAGVTGRLMYVDTRTTPIAIRNAVIGDGGHEFDRIITGAGRDEAGEIYFTATSASTFGTDSGEVWRVLERRRLGDSDRSGSIGMADILDTLRNWNLSFLPGTGPGDANSDGRVNFADIIDTLSEFSRATGSDDPNVAQVFTPDPLDPSIGR